MATSQFDKNTSFEEVKGQKASSKADKNSQNKPNLRLKRRAKKAVNKRKSEARLSLPFEIRKTIEGGVMSKDKILELIDLPKENYFKVFDNIKDISMSLVKKIETNIHKNRIQRRKLKEMFVKTYKSQNKHDDVMCSSRQSFVKKGKFSYLSHFWGSRKIFLFLLRSQEF